MYPRLASQLVTGPDGKHWAHHTCPWRNFLSRFGSKLFGLKLPFDKIVESPLWDLTHTVDSELSKSAGLSSLTVQTPPIQF